MTHAQRYFRRSIVGSVMHVFMLCLYGSVSYSLQQDCPNGRLTPAKFVDMYKMFFPSGNAEEFCDHVFRTFDMDKNGYIDFKVSAFEVVTELDWTPCNLVQHPTFRWKLLPRASISKSKPSQKILLAASFLLVAWLTLRS